MVDRKVRDSNPILADMNFSGHKKGISEVPQDQGVIWFPLRGQCLCKFDINVRLMLAAFKTGSEIVSTGRPER